MREATLDDLPELVRLINLAYRVEDFFIEGDRTDAAEVRALLDADRFLVLEAEGGRPGHLVGAVHVALPLDGQRAYFGMLSVDPKEQGRGLGRRMVTAAEAYARTHGCREMELHILDLRRELPPFYRRLGYVETGTLPFDTPLRPGYRCHRIVMRKPL